MGRGLEGMKVVITGANSAVGQAILRCAATHAQGVTPNTFVAAVRSDRAAEEVRRLLGSGYGVVRISYDDPEQSQRGFSGGLCGHPPGGNSRRTAGFDV